jgi:hypothetical protein
LVQVRRGEDQEKEDGQDSNPQSLERVPLFLERVDEKSPKAENKKETDRFRSGEIGERSKETEKKNVPKPAPTEGVPAEKDRRRQEKVIDRFCQNRS